VPDDGATLLSDTVLALSERAPAVVAAAATELRGILLALRFGDGSSAALQAQHSRLVVTFGLPEASDVEVWFDDRSMNVLFDLQHRAVDEVLPGSLDVRGERSQVLAVWRVFQLLSQRGSGLRSVQQLWRSYRQRSPQLWGDQGLAGPGPADSAGLGPEPILGESGWSALDYLARRRPSTDGPGRERIGGTVVESARSLWDGHRSTDWWDELRVLSNLESLGLGRTLGLIHEVLHMCRETIEGQAMELGWIRRGTVPSRDTAYYTMSTKKTGWYTCITPCRAGAVCAGQTSPAVLDAFVATFRLVGIAFQIQDDVLNLIGEEALYGKEPLGDLLEGKRTVMLLHLFRTAPPAEREELRANLLRPRAEKSQADAEVILDAMRRHGSIEHAIALADRLARQGVRRFEEDLAFVAENEHKAVLRQIAHYVTTRPL